VWKFDDEHPVVDSDRPSVARFHANRSHLSANKRTHLDIGYDIQSEISEIEVARNHSHHLELPGISGTRSPITGSVSVLKPTASPRSVRRPRRRRLARASKSASSGTTSTSIPLSAAVSAVGGPDYAHDGVVQPFDRRLADPAFRRGVEEVRHRERRSERGGVEVARGGHRRGFAGVRGARQPVQHRLGHGRAGFTEPR